MTKDEALKLALSTLDEVRSETFRLLRNGQKLYAEEKVWSTINAIKEALAQPEQKRPQNCGTGYCSCIECVMEPEQEPVLWNMPDDKTVDKWALQFYEGQKGKPLYATPPQRTWVGLIDTDIGDEFVRFQIKGGFTEFEYAVRAIEAKLKDKNT